MNRSGAILMWSLILVVGIPLFIFFGLVTLVAGFTAGAFTELKALFSWRTHHMAGPWVYSINPTTGQRKAVYARDFSGYVPLDWHWLREGDLLVDDAGRRIIVAKPVPVSIPIGTGRRG
jgi:hypothetical protein